MIGPHVLPFGNDLDFLGEYKSLIFPSKWCVDSCVNNFPYTLESDDWKQLEIDYLNVGSESRSMR